MRFVLDASIAVSWFFADEISAVADTTFRLIGETDGEALTPTLFWFELRNAVLIGIRRKRIVPQQATAIFGRLNRAAISFDQFQGRHDEIFALVLRHHLTFYDASYLEIAARERIPLATLDRKLADAARAERVALIGD